MECTDHCILAEHLRVIWSAIWMACVRVELNAGVIVDLDVDILCKFWCENRLCSLLRLLTLSLYGYKQVIGFRVFGGIYASEIRILLMKMSYRV